MSTIGERVAKAFKAATGEESPGAHSGAWVAENRTHLLYVKPIAGSRRREAVAQVTVKDSLNIKYLAVRSRDWTNVEVMTHMLRDAEQRAKALAAMADVLGANGWRVSPIVAPLTGGGLSASKGGKEVQVYSNGEACGHDDVAVRFARDMFEVALERAQAS